MSLERHVYVGLGSNLDDPCRQVTQALGELATLPLTRRLGASRLYASRPQGPQDQPDFINAVAWLETRLSPLALLDQLQALEQRHRRVRGQRWGPRSLDLDLLLYGSRQLHLARLTLPHPEMLGRPFVLVPLAELAAQRRLPDGRTIARAAEALDASGLRAVLPGD
ncbi:2-amino-4-hydroxy-6-hydroxymethyldihydropteridine diphosphokinase [Billgrantia gudaonensis]|uniref:2-amino-4-hydroxy-6-hydroxymethyldihydropteridine pyrophosphokinase n=1 Tax=Billgrantia gudaonensis TaxID=376427 RepID=A0A1G9CYD2_9GAMM|nr:2-amino-4-hydroxy-6-hydroxymethyldihydropteridine diphosphokinase [Halomonas gudaonensis]SDK56633.1 2-amino-4-hydroxy-6-hydroxymethyldihydropteridinediphosphokinase [Halomonas gudaonensis]